MVHVVEPGQTLWGIAQDKLGDGARYDELAQAAASTVQPGGVTLEDPDLIRPGWVIPLPGAPAVSAPVPKAPEAAAPPVATAAPSIPDQAQSDANTGAGAAAGKEQPASAGEVASAEDIDLGQGDEAHAAPWMLPGLTGAGVVLAGSMFLLLHQRRRAQSRSRRPGRMIALPAKALAPVERTVVVSGGAWALTIDQVDAVLRRMAAARAQAGLAMPVLAALELSHTQLVLHLGEPCDLPSPWEGTDDRVHWTCVAMVDADEIGPLSQDQPAPYPLLATIGAGPDGPTWLLNFEQMGAVSIAGDRARGQDLARYLVAELASNPWSREVVVDCIGLAQECAPMSPDRVRYHPQPGSKVPADALADARSTIGRARAHGADVATARAAQRGDDAWGSRLVLVDAHAASGPAWAELVSVAAEHAGRTGTSVVLAGVHQDHPGVVLDVSAEGRVSLPHAGLDLVVVGLTQDEARGCAAMLAHSENLRDTEVPCQDQAEGWRTWADETGALRREHTLPRQTPAGELEEPAESLLDGSDEQYLRVCATTAQDLAALAPPVPVRVRAAVQGADPSLDADLQAWFSPTCELPRLTLLGPVTARTRGQAVTKRKPYYTEMLAYLATRPHGATPAELADAFGIAPARARNDVKIVRDWLGVNPRTGTKHLPDADKSAAAKARGVGVYQVQDVLVDADLFRRLRLRGQTGGAAGLQDLRRALMLVTGKPCDQLRTGGWSWMAQGDRLDQHLLCAVVDVAHLVTTSALRDGDLARARAAAELAALAAPSEEIPRLDLAAVTAAEGHAHAAERIALEEVCNRSDDGGPPLELSERTERIIATHDWLHTDRAVS